MQDYLQGSAGFITGQLLIDPMAMEAQDGSASSVLRERHTVAIHVAMMDDVEGILEAERVALEMERRDLYTARCRHWFGGI